MTRALIVVDVQNDFVEDGSLAVAGGKAIAKSISTELLSSSAYDFKVATMDWHIDPGDHWSETPDYLDSWPMHCAAGTAGSFLAEPLTLELFDTYFHKGHWEAAYSGFEGTCEVDANYLETWLNDRNIDKIDVVGIAYDYCVKATALDGVKEGFKTRVLSEYTVSVHPQNDLKTTRELMAGGVHFA